MEFTEEYLEVLQDLESPAMWLYQQYPGLLDDQVLEAYDALIKTYTRKARGKEPKPVALDSLELRLYEAVEAIAEEWVTACPETGPEEPPLTIHELLNCLKRLRKSVRTWSAEEGPQGYLWFITGGYNSPEYQAFG